MEPFSRGQLQARFWRTKATRPKGCPTQTGGTLPQMCTVSIIPLIVSFNRYKPSDRPDFAEILMLLKEIERELPKDTAAPTDANSPASAKHHTPPPVQQQPQPAQTPINEPPIQTEPKKDKNENQGSYLQTILSRQLALSYAEKVVSEKQLSKMVQRYGSECILLTCGEVLLLSIMRQNMWKTYWYAVSIPFG